MATIKDIDDFFDKLTNEFMANSVPTIISREAIKFFQERFTTKEWDGTPWPETKVPVKRGTLMVRSGDLVNSIKEKSKSPEKVVISAGSDKVPYARPHNEGETLSVPVTAKMRKFAWAMHFNEQTEGEKEVYTQWKGLALTKKTELKIKLPMRRFMGPSEKLNDVLFNALRDEFNKL